MKGEWNTETKIETQNHLLSIYSEINYFIKIAADSFSLLPIKIKRHYMVSTRWIPWYNHRRKTIVWKSELIIFGLKGYFCKRILFERTRFRYCALNILKCLCVFLCEMEEIYFPKYVFNFLGCFNAKLLS